MDGAFNSGPDNLPQGYLDYVTPKNIEDKLRERDSLFDDEKDMIDLITDETYESFKKVFSTKHAKVAQKCSVCYTGCASRI